MNSIELSINNLEIVSTALAKLADKDEYETDQSWSLFHMSQDLLYNATVLRNRFLDKEKKTCSCGNYCMNCLDLSNKSFMN
jgi:hypothetical protein